MGFTVVVGGIVRAGDRHGHIDRIDLLITVGHFEGNVPEVRVLVAELFRLQAHRGLARIRQDCGIRSLEDDVILDIVQSAVGSGSVAGYGMGFTVIVGSVACAGDRYDHIDRVDLLIAVRHVEDDFCKVRVLVGELSGIQTHECGVRVGQGRSSRSAEGEVSFLVQRIADFHIITADAVILAVIIRGIAVAGNSHNHLVHRRDRLVTVLIHRKGHSTEVRVRIGELVSRQVHVRGAHVGLRRFRSSSEDEVLLHVIQSGVGSGGVAARFVLCAVVNMCIVVADDGYSRINRFNGLIAVCYVKGDSGEVRIRIGELVSCQAHVLSARIGLCRFCGSVEGEVILHIIQIGAGSGGVAVHGVLCAVIRQRAARAGNRHSHVDRINGLIAVRHGKGNIGEVLIRVRELFSRQAHVRGARVGPHRFRVSAEGEVFRHVIQITVGSGGVALHFVLSTVIIRRIVRTDNGHGHIDRINGLIAIGHIEGHSTEVRVLVLELFSLQAHVRGACIGQSC